MPVEYRGFEGVTKFFYLACTKIQGVQEGTKHTYTLVYVDS